MRAAERDGSHAKLRAGDRGSSLGVNLGLLPASTASFVLPSRGQALCHSEASPPPRVFISSRPKRALDGSQWHKRLPLWKRVDGQQRHIRGRQGVPTEAPLGRSCLARPVFQAAISKQPPPPPTATPLFWRTWTQPEHRFKKNSSFRFQVLMDIL